MATTSPSTRAPRGERGRATAITRRRQAQADAEELNIAERYHRRQEFGALVAEAIRRAEAMTRLERALALRLG